MFTKSIGEPCPKCAAPLIRRHRAARFMSEGADVAFCARCIAAWELSPEARGDPNLFPCEENAHP